MICRIYGVVFPIYYKNDKIYIPERSNWARCVVLSFDTTYSFSYILQSRGHTIHSYIVDGFSL